MICTPLFVLTVRFINPLRLHSQYLGSRRIQDVSTTVHLRIVGYSYIMYIYIYIFGYFNHEFPWICGLTGFSRPPFFPEETQIQNLNMAGELFHGFKN